MVPLILRVRSWGGGALHVEIGDPERAAARARLPAEIVERVLRDLSEARRLPLILSRDADARLGWHEEAQGRALAGLLRADPGLIGGLAEAWGRAQAVAQRLLIVVDAEPGLAELPWELLADPVTELPLEPSGRAVIVRLEEGRPQIPPQGRWRAELRATDAEDPTVQDLTRRLEEGLPAAHRPDPERPGMLVLLGHGRIDEGETRLMVGPDLHAGGTAVQGALPALSGVGLVVTAVCESRGAPQDLARRLREAGAPAVLAPDGRVESRAVPPLVLGLWSALDAGATLPEAVAAGRRALRRAAMDAPSARWHRWILSISALDAIGRLRGPDLIGSAEEWVRLASELAARDSMGYVGFEALLLALCARAPDPELLDQRSVALGREGRLRELARGYQLRHAFVAPALTPRLRAALAHGGADLAPAELWTRLTAAVETWWTGHFQRRFVARSPDTVGTHDLPDAANGDPAASTPAITLEILGGPEDGRRLEPRPGAWLGRWDPNAPDPGALYATAAVTDMQLSRRHLRWLGPGHLETRSGTPCRIAEGQALALTDRTMLLGRGSP